MGSEERLGEQTDAVPRGGTSSSATLRDRTVVRALVGTFAIGGSVVIVAVATSAYGGAALDRVVINALVAMVAVVGLGLFTGNSGILNFGSTAFAAIGAYSAGILTASPLIKERTLTGLPEALVAAELSFWTTVAAAAIVSLVVTLVIAVPLSRLRGAGAAIATLAWLIIVHVLLNGARSVTRGSQTFYGVPALLSLGSALVVLIVAIFIARTFKESRFGLRLRASRDDDLAARALGVNVELARYIGLSLSGCLLGVAGALSAFSLGAFSPRQFYLVLAFTYLAMLIVGGAATVTGAVMGTAVVTALTEVTRRFEGGVTVFGATLPKLFGLTQVALGIGLILAIAWRPKGIFGHRELDEIGVGWIRQRSAHADDGQADEELPDSQLLGPIPQTADVLVIEGIGKLFGGVQALAAVELTVAPREVVGLIGPNGSGKTTLVNVMSGVVRPDTGSVRLGATMITGLATHRIASRGLARTFQNIRLFAELSVLQNVEVGALGGRRSDHVRAVRSSARECLEALGISHLASRPAGGLSYAEQRRVELARALAAHPAVLLLDEPAAGMNGQETEALTDLLLDINETTGTAMVVIEHDLSLVMRLSHRVVVLNEGRKIADGAPGEVRENPLVLDAYLGTTDQELTTTGPREEDDVDARN
jgi:branched-chain amino acid transport system permease protein